MSKITYEKDFYRWVYQQSNLLREGKFEQLDLGHLIEELEDLGNHHSFYATNCPSAQMANSVLEADK